jgi:putative transposase
MAHKGVKAYSESFDFVHRIESEASNAIWQADQTQLDFPVRDERGKTRRPWLTIILDDYSRAVAGYMLSFAPPSAIQTALALRQAIWRKPQPGWHVCGIPQVLYTDHGSDFTSQHIEQVAADLKIRLIFSTVGKPRGRGKIERFFASLSQVFLSRLQGSARCAKEKSRTLALSDLLRELENYLINQYLVSRHSTTGQAPQADGKRAGFFPRCRNRWKSLIYYCSQCPKQGACVPMASAIKVFVTLMRLLLPM